MHIKIYSITIRVCLHMSKFKFPKYHLPKLWTTSGWIRLLLCRIKSHFVPSHRIFVVLFISTFKVITNDIPCICTFSLIKNPRNMNKTGVPPTILLSVHLVWYMSLETRIYILVSTVRKSWLWFVDFMRNGITLFLLFFFNWILLFSF